MQREALAPEGNPGDDACAANQRPKNADQAGLGAECAAGPDYGTILQD